MKSYEIKDTLPGQVNDVDTTGRKVKVVVSETGTKDLDNDIIDGAAYTKTIKERGPKGANLIWHLTDHIPSLKNAIGKPSEVSMRGSNLVMITDVPKTSWGNDMLEHYKAGTINQHSIGFRTIKSDIVNKGKEDEHRLIKEVLLYEGSAVLWGANPNTPTLSVGKSLTKEEVEKDFLETITELSKFTSLFKNGHLSDQSFELIEMKIGQLTEKLQHLYHGSTRPAEEFAVEPQNGKEQLDVLTTFKNSLTLQNYARLNSGRSAQTASN